MIDHNLTQELLEMILNQALSVEANQNENTRRHKINGWMYSIEKQNGIRYLFTWKYLAGAKYQLRLNLETKKGTMTKKVETVLEEMAFDYEGESSTEPKTLENAPWNPNPIKTQDQLTLTTKPQPLTIADVQDVPGKALYTGWRDNMTLITFSDGSKAHDFGSNYNQWKVKIGHPVPNLGTCYRTGGNWAYL